MKPEVFDIDHTIEYAHSHDLARRALPFAVMGILLGLFIMTPLDAAAPKSRDFWLGAIVVVISIGFIGAIIHRRSRPNEASIVLSPRGILFRDISEKVIPWNEIREIGAKRVTRSRDVIGVKVTKLLVSERFFDTLIGDRWSDSSVAMRGDPAEIYVSYYQPPPFGEFQEAVRRRWHAFSVHARGLQPLAPPPLMAHEAQAAAANRGEGLAPRSSRTVQRASSFGGLKTLTSIVRSSSPIQLIVIVVALAGIGALVSNRAGMWSTGAQERSRAQAAELRAWRKKQDDEDKEREAERRRFDERMNRAFRCMDWQASRTPECQRRD